VRRFKGRRDRNRHSCLVDSRALERISLGVQAVWKDDPVLQLRFAEREGHHPQRYRQGSDAKGAYHPGRRNRRHSESLHEISRDRV